MGLKLIDELSCGGEAVKVTVREVVRCGGGDRAGQRLVA
jgi:hypothetical protein